MALVDDLDNGPVIKAKTARRAKREDKPRSSASAKPRQKKSTDRKATRAVKTLTVEIAGVIYCGWYWVEGGRVHVTYNEKPRHSAV